MPRLAAAALLSLLWLAVALAAAPAPRFKPKPPPAVTPGVWVLTWASAEAPVALAPDGTLRYPWAGREYRGSWQWDAKTRTLHVRETCDGVAWIGWSAKLDGGLSGAAEFGEARVPVSLRPPWEGK